MEMTLMLLSEAMGKMIHEKTRSKKYRDTVLLNTSCVQIVSKTNGFNQDQNYVCLQLKDAFRSGIIFLVLNKSP
jgi:hypothetical protein